MPRDVPVFLKRYWYPLAAGALLLCGVAVRLALAITGWPHSNSEEGTMGLEAMHILLRGERPVYLYGQKYMGVSEAYIGALAFRVLGISVLSLRLGMIAFYAIFLGGVSWLADQLYSRRVALVSLAALMVGPPFLMGIELRADGGKAETLAAGALMFALASWLALSQPAALAPQSRRALRYGALVAWGVMAGFGLYSYAVIAPFVLASGLLLWITCRRELRGWSLALPLVGLLIGLLPVIIYSVTMPGGDNPISVFLSLHQSLNARGPSSWHLLVREVEATVLYTLPTVTGLINLYPLEALPLYGPPGPATVTAVLIGGGWGLGYLLLLGVATYRPLSALRQEWTLRRMGKHPGGDAQNDVSGQAGAPPLMTHDEARDVARLLLALAAWLTIGAYMFSATAANNPYSGRYMIGLLAITPAILWPLLHWTPRLHVRSGEVEPATRARGGILRNAWRPAAVALLGVSLIYGATRLAQTIPDHVANNKRDAKFTQDLLSHGITRFYSDYWTCDLLNFETQERLICSVIDQYAQPGRTRYAPYTAAVQAERDAPYVVVQGSSIEQTFLIYAAENHQRYSVEPLDGYNVYRPISA